jgi:hypothetical protein
LQELSQDKKYLHVAYSSTQDLPACTLSAVQYQLQRAGEKEGAGGLLSQAKLARHDRSRAEKEAMCIKENS